MRAMYKQMTLMREELVIAHRTADAYANVMEDLCGLVGDLASDNARLKARLAVYENPNAPSSARSLFNAERNAFRSKRGSRGSDGGDAKKGPKKKGPPEGHRGVSHSNKPTFCIKYRLPDHSPKSAAAGLDLGRRRPTL